MTSSGTGKRNKSKALLYLRGVQVTGIEKNRFTDSSAILAEHTAGEPITRIADNLFDHTPPPSVKELVAKGPHTAVLANNEVTQ